MSLSVLVGGGVGQGPVLTPPPPISTRSSILDPDSTAVVTITNIYFTPAVVSVAAAASLVSRLFLTALSILSLYQSSTASVLSLMTPRGNYPDISIHLSTSMAKEIYLKIRFSHVG